MFEYLMPLLLMRSYPRHTLLDAPAGWQSARNATTAASAACPGAFRSRPTSVQSTARHYQYKAFGVPGLGLKRGLSDDLVVAPYATALAALVDPAAAARTSAA
jgi:cyclic beta-1,2-glucan synthetase